jgi:hypothetical protein
VEEKITHAVAATGVASASTPWWLPTLDQSAKVIALIYSVLGCIWLVKKIFGSGKSSEQ